MQFLFFVIFKIIRNVLLRIEVFITTNYTKIILYLNNASFRKIVSYGVPIIQVSMNAKLKIGYNFHMNNGERFNPIGRNSKCFLIVRNDGELIINNNVGISSCAINCQLKITIEDNVKIGGGVCIYDSDFHSLNYEDRKEFSKDSINIKALPVVVKENVFIGAHSTILKGVVIGENSIIGACSVVTTNIPSNELWAGNPAKFIRKL